MLNTRRNRAGPGTAAGPPDRTQDSAFGDERAYQTLIESAPALFYRAHPNGRLKWCSERFLEYSGTGASELAGEGWAPTSLVHPDDLAEASDRWGRCMDNGERFEMELRLRGTDGVYRWFISNALPVQDEQGQVYEWAGSLVDIHERKKVEAALTESERLFRTIAETAPVFVFRADSKGGLTYASERFCQYSGVPFEKLTGDDWRLVDIVHPEDLPEVLERWPRVVQGGKSEGMAVRLRAADGSYRWYLTQVAAIRDEGGRIVEWTGTATDIHDRKLTEEALSASEASQGFLADATAALASSFDYEGNLCEVARLAVPAICDVCVIDTITEDGELRRVKAIGANEREGELISQIHLRDWRMPGMEESQVLAGLNQGRAVYLPEIPGQLIDYLAPNEGQRLLVHELGPRSVIQVPLRTRGRVLGIITFLNTHSDRGFDATDLAMAEELARRAGISSDNARLYAEAQRTMDELRRANAIKDEFVGLISHELRTPITTIYGNARLIRDKLDQMPEELRARAADDLATESERLHRIVENLLLLTQVDAGKRLELEPLHLPNLVREWVEAFRRYQPRRKVEVHYDSSVPVALGVPTYVELVCGNLLGNADKYSPAEAAIGVVVASDVNGDPEVIVWDTGPGIDPDEAEELFRPFYRSRRTPASVKGIGVGLSVSRRVIEAQGGRIWARARIGGGAEFGFSLRSAVGEGLERT